MFKSYRGLITLGRYVKKDLSLYFFAVIFFAISSLGNVGMAELVHKMEDAYTNPDSWWRLYIPLGIVGITLMRGLGGILGGLTTSFISVNISAKLSMRMYRHLMWLPRNFYDKTSTGEAMNKLGYNVGLIVGALNSGLSVLLRDGTSFCFLLIYLLYFNWLLTLIIFVTVPVMLVMIYFFRKRIKVLAERLRKLAVLLSRRVIDAFGALSLIKASAAEDYEFKRYKKLIARNKKQSLKMVAVSAVLSPLLSVVVSIAFATIIWVAMNAESVGFSTFGEFMGYITAIFLLGPHIRKLSGVQSKMVAGEMAARDYMEYLKLSYEPNTGKGLITPTEQQQDIRIENLSFAYKKGTPVFENLNLKIIGGSKNALVGKSGSGKSTIVNLLFRFYQSEKGVIRIGGTDLQELELYAWRAGIAYVSQDIFLFDDTLRYNLTYGLQRNATDEELKIALERAQAWEFVEKMPKQLKAVIGEKGVLLSGGQKQRIVLARALIRNSPILILDEATSSLDTDTEYKIQLALEEIMRDRTVLVIAHRLSTVRKMDKIIVLDKGQVLEEGSHKELLIKKGHYASLYRRQFSD